MTEQVFIQIEKYASKGMSRREIYVLTRDALDIPFKEFQLQAIDRNSAVGRSIEKGTSMAREQFLDKLWNQMDEGVVTASRQLEGILNDERTEQVKREAFPGLYDD